MTRNLPLTSAIPVERVCRTFADVFEVPSEEITLDSTPDTVETWDSINHLNLVMALEQEFDVQFEPEEIEELLSVRATIEIVSGKLGGSAKANQ